MNDPSVKQIQNALEVIGCRLYKQDGSGVSSNIDALVVSTAIEETNPDIVKARALNIPIWHRSELLAAIVNTKKTIAIAGTSGKSSVTALVFHLLCAYGKKPSLITGANLHELIEKGILGNAYKGDSEILVIEADESDGSLVHYRPFLSVFLNVSKDHKPVPETLSFFKTLAQQSSQALVNYDERDLHVIQPAQTFGLDNNADFFPDKTELGQNSVALIKNSVTFTLPMPGKHNIYNLLAALHVCRILGCGNEPLAQAVAGYKGVERRFDRIETARGVLVIDDYAHNPEKISAVLETAQNLSPRVIAVFQPHGFGPTRFLLRELIETFNSKLRINDILYLLPIYDAGGTAKKDVSSQDIARGLKNAQGRIFTPGQRHDIAAPIAATAKSGNIVLLMGARDPSLPALAQSIAKAIDEKIKKSII